jgi:UDP-glucose 4-epimerase
VVTACAIARSGLSPEIAFKETQVVGIKGGRFVVVGGASLIGSHIAERLLSSGAAKVLLLDNMALGTSEGVQPLLGDRCQLVRGDALRINELFDAFEGTDGVFAVAGFLGMVMQANPWAGLDVNVRGIQNVFEAARYRGVKKVVYSSSVGAYGAAKETQVDESSPFYWQGISTGMALYGATKVIGETLALHYNQRYGLQSVCLRYSSVYGERLHSRGFSAINLRETYESVRAGKAPVLVGDGSQVFDYVYAGDAANANILAMESDVTNEAFNIVTGVDTSLRQITDVVIKVCDSELTPIFKEGKVEHVSSALPTLGYSREKAKKLLHWEPELSLEEGVHRLVRWFDEQAKSEKAGENFLCTTTQQSGLRLLQGG